MRTRSRLAIVAAAMVLTAACGASDDTASGPDPATDTAPEPVDSRTENPTTTTTTTQPVRQPLPVLDPADIPELITAWEEASGTPLELAQALTGFPLRVPMPEGTTPYRVELDMKGRNPGDLWYWEWSYHATTDQPIPDIDIDSDGMGPGAVALRETYDPIMAEIGWGYSNTTGSDPSSGAGGPQSVNHVYRSTTAVVPIGEADASPLSLFVWADEELIFGEGVPGYQIDVDFEIEPGFIPAPIVAALLSDLPFDADARLVDISLSSFERTTDSFDAAEGLRYLEFKAEWVLEAASAGPYKDLVSSDLGGIYQPGEESFFDPGFIEAAGPTEFDGDWTQPVVVLDRYPGAIEIVEDPDTESASISLEIRFEANREILEQLPEE